jgi:hypothetical protein
LKITIEKVVSEEDKELRYESWIIVKLANGQKIELYHQGDHDFRKYLGKTLDCLIYIASPYNINNNLNSDKPSIKGTYLGEFNVPTKYTRVNRELYAGRLDAVKTEIGIFIIGYLIGKKLEIKKGDRIKFNVTNFVLWDWLPIEK